MNTMFLVWTKLLEEPKLNLRESSLSCKTSRRVVILGGNDKSIKKEILLEARDIQKL